MLAQQGKMEGGLSVTITPRGPFLCPLTVLRKQSLQMDTLPLTSALTFPRCGGHLIPERAMVPSHPTHLRAATMARESHTGPCSSWTAPLGLKAMEPNLIGKE